MSLFTDFASLNISLILSRLPSSLCASLTPLSPPIHPCPLFCISCRAPHRLRSELLTALPWACTISPRNAPQRKVQLFCVCASMCLFQYLHFSLFPFSLACVCSLYFILSHSCLSASIHPSLPPCIPPSSLYSPTTTGLPAARDGLLGTARASLVKSLLACPPNLQWKVWLAGARLELSAGSLGKARR